MYFLSNWLKVGLACLADLINQLWDPFEEFTRPVQPKYGNTDTIERQAAAFEEHMIRGFYQPDLALWVHTRNRGDYHTLRDIGDQALWQGIYTAMWAIKFSVTRDPLDALRAEEGMAGMRLHQGPGRLIRGVSNDLTITDDASNDSATGHLMGLYFAWKYGNAITRAMATDLIDSLALELLSHDYALVDAKGQPTTFGKLVDGHKTDPLGLTLCLAILKFAAVANNDDWYERAYDDLARRYAPILPYANLRLLWLGQTSQPMRAAIHYTILCDLEKEHDLQRRYLYGLMRTWKMERKSANPFIYYLLRRQMLLDPGELPNVMKHLTEMTLEDKCRNFERINSDKVPTFNWGGHKRTRQPLPRWKVGSQDFFWQRTAYAADDWIGSDGGTEHNGGDFLIAYWGLRQLRLI